MKYELFINKYFDTNRQTEILQNMTPKKYRDIFGVLSECQTSIISDKVSRCIVVAAGPGSGKTRVLVHKLASLLLLEDVKHEQLLMLTFSRSAATEFKQRLVDLIGNAANYVEITTFHSYCFELLGRVGSLEESQNVVADAVDVINRGEVEPNKIRKTVLVIDEAQDMSANEYNLIMALISQNDDLRIIAVGDDDQNIYGFRGSDSNYMIQLQKDLDGVMVEMVENYRSSKTVVDVANQFVSAIRGRIKSNKIISKSDSAGYVSVTQYSSKIIYNPIVVDIMKRKGAGTICILTKTNEEAAIYVALLQKYGVKCRLIQSTDGFRFVNLVEVRYFLRFLRKNLVSPLISSELWEKAKSVTFEKYADSSSLVYLCNCIKQFEQCNKTKYITDLKSFVVESSLEDFVDVDGADVLVSTIHKSKGREFDDVYISYVSSNGNIDDEGLRCLYVAMTRAKQRLFIHTNTSLFKGLPATDYFYDTHAYDMLGEVVLPLSFKDVYLDYFKTVKTDVLALRGGSRLIFANEALYLSGCDTPIAKLARDMCNRLEAWKAKGYIVKTALVRFIVAWKPKGDQADNNEYAVLLPDLYLQKKEEL